MEKELSKITETLCEDTEIQENDDDVAVYDGLNKVMNTDAEMIAEAPGESMVEDDCVDEENLLAMEKDTNAESCDAEEDGAIHIEDNGINMDDLIEVDSTWDKVENEVESHKDNAQSVCTDSIAVLATSPVKQLASQDTPVKKAPFVIKKSAKSDSQSTERSSVVNSLPTTICRNVTTVKISVATGTMVASSLKSVKSAASNLVTSKSPVTPFIKPKTSVSSKFVIRKRPPSVIANAISSRVEMKVAASDAALTSVTSDAVKLNQSSVSESGDESFNVQVDDNVVNEIDADLLDHSKSLDANSHNSVVNEAVDDGGTSDLSQSKTDVDVTNGDETKYSEHVAPSELSGDGSDGAVTTQKNGKSVHQRSTHDGKPVKSDTFQSESRQKDGNVSKTKLWVSGLSLHIRAADLKKCFGKHGKVISAKVVTNARVPSNRCFGLVTMENKDVAIKCIQCVHRTLFHGRVLSVQLFSLANEKNRGSVAKPSSIGETNAEPAGEENSEKMRQKERSRISFEKIRAERERERLRRKEFRLRNEERLRLEELDRERMKQKFINRQQREEAMELEREKERIRVERERLEFEKMEAEQMKRESSRMKRLAEEKMMRERERLDDERRSLKRSGSFKSRMDSDGIWAEAAKHSRKDSFKSSRGTFEGRHDMHKSGASDLWGDPGYSNSKMGGSWGQEAPESSSGDRWMASGIYGRGSSRTTSAYMAKLSGGGGGMTRGGESRNQSSRFNMSAITARSRY